jgi:hypothetical protein
MKAIVYSAVGKDFIWQACVSAKSVKHLMPDVKIIIYADQIFECEYFDEIHHFSINYDIDPSIKGVKVKKMEALSQLPAGHYIFLDCDTYCVERFDELFDLLENFDFGVCFDNWRMYQSDKAVQTYNSGVMVFRKNDEVSNFIDSWVFNYLKESAIPDQYTFNKLLTSSRLRFVTLPPEYNFRAGELNLLSGKVKIVHKHHKASVDKNNAAIGVFVNTVEVTRLYYPGGRMCYLNGDELIDVNISSPDFLSKNFEKIAYDSLSVKYKLI